MPIPKRLPYEAALIAAVMLGSCSEGSRFVTHDQATDIADDSAATAIAENEKIKDIEGRLEAVEERLRM